jgi:hypothetical protein
MGRLPKERTQVVPAYPEPYVRQPARIAQPRLKKKRGRPRKNGRPKEDTYDGVRSSPSKRAGKRWITVSLPEEAYYMLKEVAAFYKVGMGAYMQGLLKTAFDHAYKESLTLQRIDNNRKKAKDEIPDRDDVPRRTHF